MNTIHKLTIGLLILTVLLFSCSKEDSSVPKMFKVSCLKGNVDGTTPATKTIHEFSGNTLKVKWNKGDEIAVSNGTNLYRFIQTGELSNDGHSALFKTVSSVSFVQGEMIAVYPYTTNLTSKGIMKYWIKAKNQYNYSINAVCLKTQIAII